MHASVAQFLARVSPKTVRELLDKDEDAELVAADEARITSALEDATGELDALLMQLPAGKRPTAATLVIHAVKVATYLLSIGKPAAETEQIRNAYTDTIQFYKDLIASAVSADPAGGGQGQELVVTGCAPPRIFTHRSFRGM